MSNRDIPQEDIIDADGNDPRTVVTRLTIVHDIVLRVNNRLLDITNRWIGPGPPEQPATLDRLNLIRTESVRATAMAEALISRITGGGSAPPGGPSPDDTGLSTDQRDKHDHHKDKKDKDKDKP